MSVEDVAEELKSLQQQRSHAAAEAAKWADAVKHLDGAIGFARGMLAKYPENAPELVEAAG